MPGLVAKQSAILVPKPLVYTTRVLEGRTGGILTTPAYPNDRAAGDPWLGFISKNDLASEHRNEIFANAKFPIQTLLRSVYPLDGGTTVRAFGFIDYGNYLDAISPVPAAKINGITALQSSWDFKFTGTVGGANGCLDWFLYNTPSGASANIVAEIQVYWDTPLSTRTNFLDTLPVVGTYASAAIGRTGPLNWKVTYEASNTQGVPYYQFCPLDANGVPITMHTGDFDLLAAMMWLTTQAKPSGVGAMCLTGSEWFTGFGNGYEVLNGAVELFVKTIATAYVKAPQATVAAAFPAFTNLLPANKLAPNGGGWTANSSTLRSDGWNDTGTTSVTHGFYDNTGGITASPSTTYTFMVDVDETLMPWAMLQMFQQTWTKPGQAFFDIINMTAAGIVASGVTNVIAQVNPVDNGRKRLSIQWTSASDASKIIAQVKSATGNYGDSYVSTGKGMNVYQMTLYAGAIPGSY